MLTLPCKATENTVVDLHVPELSTKCSSVVSKSDHLVKILPANFLKVFIHAYFRKTYAYLPTTGWTHSTNVPMQFSSFSVVFPHQSGRRTSMHLVAYGQVYSILPPCDQVKSEIMCKTLAAHSQYTLNFPRKTTKNT